MKKTIIILIALVFGITAYTQEAGTVGKYASPEVYAQRAVIGKTLAELRARFGHEQKSEPAWCGGTAYGFICGKYYIYAIINASGRVHDVYYAANQWPFRKLTTKETDQFFVDNQGAKTYDNFTYSANWNSRHEFRKGYGMEKGIKHWVEYSWDNTVCLISNFGPINKPEAERFGYQVRTLEQFTAEQKVIKKMTETR
jgi:hypothetical protein